MMRKVGHLLAVLIAAIVLFWLVAPKQELTSVDAKDFDGFVTALMTGRSIPGLAIAVIKHGQVIRLEGRGFADVASRRPMTAHTPMNVANPHHPLSTITLRQLATHTSSIADFADPADYTEDADSAIPLNEHLEG